MAKTVVGLFENLSDAEGVVADLETAGFRRADVSILARDEAAIAGAAEDVGDERSEGGDAGRAALKGAGTGAAIGGGIGLAAGLASLAIPGFGPVIAAGPIAAALTGAGIGAAAGGLIGGLTHIGVPETDATYYAEGVRRGGTLVTVRAADDDEAERAADVLEDHGAVDVDERSEQWRTAGWTPGDAQGAGANSDAGAATRASQRRDRDVPAEQTIPVVEEQVAVGKRQVNRGGVRLYAHVTEQPVEETVDLREEQVKVERRPVDRTATAADMSAFRDATVELTETREEPVVSKTARVVEEVAVGKEVRDRRETIRDTARRTDVEVQPLQGDAEDESDFRRHFQSRFADRGHEYDRYAPAYRFGGTSARDERYGERDWTAVEPTLRRDWEARDQGPWEDAKDSIRYGWERMRGRR